MERIIFLTMIHESFVSSYPEHITMQIKAGEEIYEDEGREKNEAYDGGMEFMLLMAVNIKITVLLNVTPYSLVGRHLRFGGTYSLDHIATSQKTVILRWRTE
jgi:hypothetical protein